MAHAIAVCGWTTCPRSMQDRVRPGRVAELADDQRQQQRAQGVQDDPGGDLAAGQSSALGPADWQVESCRWPARRFGLVASTGSHASTSSCTHEWYMTCPATLPSPPGTVGAWRPGAAA